jgi:hypothetical protein
MAFGSSFVQEGMFELSVPVHAHATAGGDSLGYPPIYVVVSLWHKKLLSIYFVARVDQVICDCD